MAVNVAAVMRQINNYFEVGHMDGTIVISGNAILPVPRAEWCFVKGSMTHDGVWQVSDGVLTDVTAYHPDEEFDGRIWLLSPPADFLALCSEISAFDDKNPTGAYLQESFGGYSYIRSQNIAGRSWRDVFKERLAPYRRMFTEVG